MSDRRYFGSVVTIPDAVSMSAKSDSLPSGAGFIVMSSTSDMKPSSAAGTGPSMSGDRPTCASEKPDSWLNQSIHAREVATMVLGSWAIPQMAAAGEAAGADPSDIAYMPTPSQVDGKFHTVAGGDYNLGINVNSKNKATARAWIDWFNKDSGYSESQVGLSPLIDGTVPAALESFMSQVELITMNPAPEGKESLFADIDTASGIVTTDPKYRLQIIDDARSGDRTKEQIFDDLNAKWAEGRADAGA